VPVENLPRLWKGRQEKKLQSRVAIRECTNSIGNITALSPPWTLVLDFFDRSMWGRLSPEVLYFDIVLSASSMMQRVASG
jgi:hypothetical protein